MFLICDPFAAAYVLRFAVPGVNAACGHHPTGMTDSAAPGSAIMGYGTVSLTLRITPIQFGLVFSLGLSCFTGTVSGLHVRNPFMEEC